MGDQVGNVVVAGSPLSALDVEFEIGIARGDAYDMLEGLRGEGRAAEVCMQDNPRGVDDGRKLTA